MEKVLPLALFILQEAIQNEPGIEAAIRALFAKPAITADDWKALRAKVASKSYADYVPDSALPQLAAPAPTIAAEPPAAPAAAPALALAPAQPAPTPPPAIAAVFTGQATDPHAQ
jgi:hypothetical protein